MMPGSVSCSRDEVLKIVRGDSFREERLSDTSCRCGWRNDVIAMKMLDVVVFSTNL